MDEVLNSFLTLSLDEKLIIIEEILLRNISINTHFPPAHHSVP